MTNTLFASLVLEVADCCLIQLPGFELALDPDTAYNVENKLNLRKLEQKQGLQNYVESWLSYL